MEIDAKNIYVGGMLDWKVSCRRTVDQPVAPIRLHHYRQVCQHIASVRKETRGAMKIKPLFFWVTGFAVTLKSCHSERHSRPDRESMKIGTDVYRSPHSRG